jgi:REP element-mobilizing transposase RayT
MSHTNIMVHAVWGTKNRYPFLTPEIKQKLCNHIRENARKKGIHIDTINGHTEHMHSLMGLKRDLSIATQMQLIKGESAYWSNLNKLFKNHFGWADEYFAESVSPSQLDGVRAYIRNQEEHHRKISFKEEFEELLKTLEFCQGPKPTDASENSAEAE